MNSIRLFALVPVQDQERPEAGLPKGAEMMPPHTFLVLSQRKSRKHVKTLARRISMQQQKKKKIEKRRND